MRRFRDEIRAFLDRALTPELIDAQRNCPGIFLDYEHNIRWHRILFQQGWIAPGWPESYGGTGWDLVQRYLWTRETSLARAPSLAPMGLGMCGPMLIGHGYSGAEGLLPATNPVRRRLLVSGVLRAGVRVGPRLAATVSATRW